MFDFLKKPLKIGSTTDENQLTSTTMCVSNFSVVGELDSNIPRMIVAPVSP